MKVKRFSLVFGSIFLFLMLMSFASAAFVDSIEFTDSGGTPIDSLTYNEGDTTTIYMVVGSTGIINTYAGNRYDFQINNYNTGAVVSSAVASGTVPASGATVSDDWAIFPNYASLVNYSMTIKIFDAGENLLYSYTGGFLEILQGATDGTSGGCDYATCGDGSCDSGCGETSSNCATDCVVTPTCQPYTNAQRTWTNLSGLTTTGENKGTTVKLNVTGLSSCVYGKSVTFYIKNAATNAGITTLSAIVNNDGTITPQSFALLDSHPSTLDYHIVITGNISSDSTTLSAYTPAATCSPFSSAVGLWRDSSDVSTITTYSSTPLSVKTKVTGLDSCANTKTGTFKVYNSGSGVLVTSLTGVTVSATSAVQSWTISSGTTPYYFGLSIDGNEQLFSSNVLSYSAPTGCDNDGVCDSGENGLNCANDCAVSGMWMDNSGEINTKTTGNSVSNVLTNLRLSSGTGTIYIYKNTSINEYKTVSCTISASGSCVYSWTISDSDLTNGKPTKFYFKFRDSTGLYDFSSKLLEVTPSATVVDFTNIAGSWNESSLTFIEGTNGPSVRATVTGIIAPDNYPIAFSIYEKDALGGDDSIRTLTTQIYGGAAIVEWTLNDYDINLGKDFLEVSPYEFYFDVNAGSASKSFSNNELSVTVNSPPVSPSLSNADASWRNITNDNIVTSTDYITGSSISIKARVSGIENAEGMTSYFTVYKDGTPIDYGLAGSTISGGITELIYTISSTTVETAEYYFKLTVGTVSKTYSTNADKLYVTVSAQELPPGVIIDVSNSDGSWYNTAGSAWIPNVTIDVGGSYTATMLVTGITGVPITGATVYFDVYEKDTLIDDTIATGLATTANQDGSAVLQIVLSATDLASLASSDDPADSLGQANYELYFKISNGTETKSFKNSDLLEVFVEDTITCSLVTVCADYDNEGQCNVDSCGVSGVSVPAEINCSDPSTNCYCLWNATELTCGPKADITYIILPPGVSSIGSCTYNENMGTDDCSDGFLSYSWTALWAWGEGNQFTPAQYNALTDPDKATNYLFDGVYYRYDPKRQSLNCLLGQNTIPCPAQVQLSGFNWVNLVIALVVVALIYWLFAIDKKKKKSSSRKTNSKKKRK